MSDLTSSAGLHTYPGSFIPRLKLLRCEVDFALDPLAQAGYHDLIPIRGGGWVLGVEWQVQRVEGAARNFSLGDADAADNWVLSTTMNALAKGKSSPEFTLTEGTPNVIVKASVNGFSNGKIYTADTAIRVTAPTAGGLTVGRLVVVALVADIE